MTENEKVLVRDFLFSFADGTINNTVQIQFNSKTNSSSHSNSIAKCSLDS